MANENDLFGKITAQKLSRRQPVFVMYENGVSPMHIMAALSGIREMLALSGMFENKISVNNLGAWRQPGFYDEQYAAWGNIDFFLERARELSRRPTQIDADIILSHLGGEPWRDPAKCGERHYDVVIVQSDMYSDGTNFVVGLAQTGMGAVISTDKFQSLDQVTQTECIKTVVMHEVGHVFGLIPETRVSHVENCLGRHCTNRCIMRQGLRLPDDWIRMTYDRFQRGALCWECELDILEFFREPR
jgi:predicted Zn-dependent protease